MEKEKFIQEFLMNQLKSFNSKIQIQYFLNKLLLENNNILP